MSYVPLLVSAPMAPALALSYWAVLLGGVERFRLAEDEGAGYLTSGYWGGIVDPTTIRLVVALQGLLVVGAAYWMYWVTTTPAPAGSLLARPSFLALSLLAFWLGSIAWPLATWHARASGGSRWPPVLCLWLAAAGVLALVVGTFEAGAGALPSLAILLVANVVVLADGVGWSAAFLAR